MKMGDHIVDVGGAFGMADHHGIYVGGEQVIHFSGEVTNPGEATIRLDSLAKFSDGRQPEVADYSGILTFPPGKVVRRARSRLGEDGYSLTMNNCEHFALWCKTGKHESLQVKSAPGLLNLVISPIETILYEGRCNCGNTLTGLTTVWLCENCGIRYCWKCIQRLETRPSFVSDMIDGLIGNLAGARDLLSDRICHCGHVLDESQQIRKGIW